MREEANTARNLVGQLNALIVEMEALKDQGELFNTLMDLRDDREAARTKLFEVDPISSTFHVSCSMLSHGYAGQKCFVWIQLDN
ncbi:hypothetical protein Tco_0569507 [Tanacetum coccineum]